MSWLANIFKEPKIKNLDVDGEERFVLHKSTLARKKILKNVFTEFHQKFDRLDKEYFSGIGIRVELGAGVAPICESYPDVLATDVVLADGIDKVIDAQKMDFLDNSVRVFFGQNCFHHFSNPSLFFEELERVVIPGGGAIFLEPYYSYFARFLFPRLFKTESYDKNASNWEIQTSGPMKGANQALSYIIFERDRHIFNKMFPNLEIVHQEKCTNYLLYLFSGGLNFRQMWPNFAVPILEMIQNFLSPFDSYLALHHIIVVKKKHL